MPENRKNLKEDRHLTKPLADIKFAGLIKQSLVDYPGEIAAVLFTRGCNLQCPFCHNPQLVIKAGHSQPESIPLEMVLEFLQSHKGFLDAVVITGGEPTIYSGLPQALALIKQNGYLTKLDTNGTNPVMLQDLLQQGLVDYVAMDIKAPPDYKKYLQATGKLSPETFLNIKNSVNILLNSKVMAEFRTTVVPFLHSPEDIEAIAGAIEGGKLYSLQQFNPTGTLDTSFENIVPYSRQQMQALADRCEKYVQKIRITNI